MTTIITPEITASLATFCRAFASRWFMQPPEFTDRRGIGSRGWTAMFGDFYGRSYGGIPNPLHTDWFARLLTEATTADLDALKAAFWDAPGSDEYSKAMHSYLMHQLIGSAWEADEAEAQVSPAIPEWFRGQGWGIPEDWHCEEVPPAYTPLGPAWLAQKGFADEAEAVAALDARAAVAASVPPPSPPGARPLPGDNEPVPAPIPLPAAAGGGDERTEPPQLWRQGSMGESGPFIGLSYGHTIELATRMAAVDAAAGEGAGRRSAFSLLAAMLRDMPEEPDPLDYPDDAIITGMTWYSWDAERTRVWIRGLLIEDLEFDSITGVTLTTLLENPAADGALRPKVAATIQRLRVLSAM